MSGTLTSTAWIGSGGSGDDSATTIAAGGIQYVGFDSGGIGTAIATVIDAGGFQYVGDSGGTGTASGTTIQAGGTQYLGANGGTGTAQGVTVAGGWQIVGVSGGTGVASATTIASGGFQGVGDDGIGTAIGAIVEAGGDQALGVFGGTGSATDTFVLSGGNQDVGDFGGTGFAANTTIWAGGTQTVGNQGVGTATNTTDNGKQTVQSGGFASATTVNSGGAVFVSAGGVVQDAIVNGGAEWVTSGGSASATTVNSGGEVHVSAFGVLDDTIMSGGAAFIDGGNADDTTVGSGAVVNVSGGGVIANTTVNGGAIFVSSGGTATSSTVNRGGAIHVSSGGVLDNAIIDSGTVQLSLGATAEGAVSFAAGGAHETLDLSGLGTGVDFNGGFTAVVSGFAGTGGTPATSDVIDVAGAGAGDQVVWTQGVGSGTLQIEDTNGVGLETLTLAGTYAQNLFVLKVGASDDALLYTATPPCYLRGTRIRTQRGDVAVEELTVGDLAATVSGAMRRIVWLGRRALDVARHRDPAAVRPVRVDADAFGPGLPYRPLWLSPGHNVFCEGALIPISALINGLSVAQIDAPRVEYWHVELDAHDVILAEGLPAESYLDCGNRAAFANGAGFLEAHPDFMPKHWRETCWPIVKQGPAVAKIKARLLGRLFEQGYAIVDDADAHVVVDGRRVEPSRPDARTLIFNLPEAARDIWLRSRTFTPSHTVADNDDTRELGICVRQLRIDGECFALPPQPIPGWRAGERRDGRIARCWTSGATPLPAGARHIAIELAGPGAYWNRLATAEPREAA